ncbi:MAG TPA: polysaccharide deacetylase family protein [Candidatus Saccharimonadales bacterium]
MNTFNFKGKTISFHTRRLRRSWFFTLLFTLIIMIVAWLDVSWQITVFGNRDPAMAAQLRTSSEAHTNIFRAIPNYLPKENAAINTLLHNAALGQLQTCKHTAIARGANESKKCRVALKFDLANSHYLQATLSFQPLHEMLTSQTNRQALLFDRQTGATLPLSALFKQDVNYLAVLAHISHQQLGAIFAKAYAQNAGLQAKIQKFTAPQTSNFQNFAVLKHEKIAIIMNEFANDTTTRQPVVLTIDPAQLYPLLNERALTAFFPKLKQQKETEQRLAMAAISAVKTARQHTRPHVAANRANINCAVMKCLALTFDDGPSVYTAHILDTLASRGAAATFFVLGSQVAPYAPLLQKALRAQHEIGNHSWSHPDFTTLHDADIAAQVEQTNHAIVQITGYYPKLMRPPYAAFDERVISHIGMPIGLWNIDPSDWHYRDTYQVAQHVITQANPGAVVLLHDIYPTTAQAVPLIVDELQKQGYVFVTMSELLDINSTNVTALAGWQLRHR